MMFEAQGGQIYGDTEFEDFEVTADFKVRAKVGGEWRLLAEYDSAEEFAQVCDFYRVKRGFQPRFKFPERGFYAKYYAGDLFL